MKMRFQITGAKELEAKLKTLPLRLQKKVVRQAVRKAQKPMQVSAKANAQALVGGTMGGLIARSLQVRARRKQKRGSYTINVQFKAGMDKFIEETKSGKRHFIPAAIEYGHMAGDTYVPPIPFMREAAESTVNERMRILTEQLRVGTLREAMKAR